MLINKRNIVGNYEKMPVSERDEKIGREDDANRTINDTYDHSRISFLRQNTKQKKKTFQKKRKKIRQIRGIFYCVHSLTLAK
jgi:hypothetical protein